MATIKDLNKLTEESKPKRVWKRIGDRLEVAHPKVTAYVKSDHSILFGTKKFVAHIEGTGSLGFKTQALAKAHIEKYLD